MVLGSSPGDEPVGSRGGYLISENRNPATILLGAAVRVVLAWTGMLAVAQRQLAHGWA